MRPGLCCPSWAYFNSPAFLCEEELHCILQLFKSYLNPALFFNAFFLLFRRRGIDLVARHHLRRNHSFITNQTKKTVQAQCTDHNLCEGTKQTCPGLCARVYLGLLSVSELRQCLSLLNTGLDRGKSKNKLTCRGAITWTSEGRAACLWAIIPHLLLVLFLFQGNGWTAPKGCPVRVSGAPGRSWSPLAFQPKCRTFRPGSC